MASWARALVLAAPEPLFSVLELAQKIQVFIDARNPNSLLKSIDGRIEPFLTLLVDVEEDVG